MILRVSVKLERWSFQELKWERLQMEVILKEDQEFHVGHRRSKMHIKERHPSEDAGKQEINDPYISLYECKGITQEYFTH